MGRKHAVEPVFLGFHSGAGGGFVFCMRGALHSADAVECAGLFIYSLVTDLKGKPLI
jgi:hypothetical protein